MSEEFVPVESVAETETQETAAPASEGNPESVEATQEEAKANNYVPYDRFKAVIEQRNQAQVALEERQRVLDYYASNNVNQPAAQQETYQSEDVWEDPLEVARQAKLEAQNLRAEIQASKQAEAIRSQVSSVVKDIGFTDPASASTRIQQYMGQYLTNTGKLPDVMEVARALRQQEIDYEKKIISRYTDKKTGGAARAASAPPASAPVLEQQPEKKAGWGGASKRVLERMRRR